MTRQPLLPVSEALKKILDSIQPVSGFVQLHLQAALGHILDLNVLSPIDVPGHANSAMDGYAMHSNDIPDTGETALRLVGTALAGHAFTGRPGKGECIRIMTGAKMPEGTDTVVMQEEARYEADTVFIGNTVRRGDHVRLPGEDICHGQTVLPAGRCLTPADLGLLASLGIAEVRVKRPLRVAFFSTGDELCSLSEPLTEGKIYDSNRYTLHGMLQMLGVEIIDMGVIRDQPDKIEAAFRQATEVADVLLTSGGVSVGDADYVKDTLEKLGKVSFWKIAMKPGKPLAFGKLGKTVFFGLPGNPVSSMATFYQLVLPALKAMRGQPPALPLHLRVRCSTPLRKTPGRADYQRGILEEDARGELVVRSTGPQGSHILSSMSHANCFIILPAESGNLPADSEVEVQPFSSLFS